jgi:hypothetical protein
MIQKSYILYAIAVIVVATLGAISYHQVAVVNAPQSPDDALIKEDDQIKKTTVTSDQPTRQTFESKDKDLRFFYPNNWTLVDNTPNDENGTYGKIIQSFLLTSYEPSKVVSGGLPENAVRVEGVVSLGGKDKETLMLRNKSLDQIIDCGGKTISCDNSEINGTLFKRATHGLNNGNILIQLASKNQDKIYMFTVVVSSGSEQQKQLAQAEQLIKSIVIIK